MNFETFFPRYLATAQHGIEASSLARYKSLGKHVVRHVGMVPLAEITPSTASSLYTTLKGELSQSTVAQVHVVFRSALDAAVHERLIPGNPLSAFKFKVKGVKAKPRALERHDLDRLIEGFKRARKGKPHALYPLVALAAHTGMRRNEMLALRWSDCLLDQRTIRVDRSLIEIDGDVSVKDPKSAASQRTIEISRALVKLLMCHRKDLGARYPDSGFVFPAAKADPHTPLTPTAVSKSFSRRAKRIDSRFRDLRLHDLRHSHASILMAELVPLKAISQRLGHSSVAVTLDVYGHLLKETRDQLRSVLEKL